MYINGFVLCDSVTCEEEAQDQFEYEREQVHIEVDRQFGYYDY